MGEFIFRNKEKKLAFSEFLKNVETVSENCKRKWWEKYRIYILSYLLIDVKMKAWRSTWALKLNKKLLLSREYSHGCQRCARASGTCTVHIKYVAWLGLVSHDTHGFSGTKDRTDQICRDNLQKKNFSS